MYIRMVGDTTHYQGTLERIGLHLIKVSGLIQHMSGFRLYLDNDIMVGDYSAFTYPYLDPNLGEGVYMYSDNNMDYKEEQSKPSREEQEKQKIERIIDDKVGKDINSLSQQLININDMILPMYEVLLDIQEALTPTEKKQETETPTKENEEKVVE